MSLLPARHAFENTLGLILFLSAGCSSPDNLPRPELAADDTLRILAYNIHHAEGMDEVVDLDRIAALILEYDPDLVAIQEVDSVTNRTGKVDQAQELARMTEMEHRFGRFMEYQGGAYGMAVLSKLPILETSNYILPEGPEPRTALSVEIQLAGSGRRVRFIGIHFYRTDEERLAQANRLEEYLADEPHLPTILAGDFNSTPGSEVMEHLGLSWEVVEKGTDHFTFPSYGPEREIDFFLLKPAGQFEILRQQLIDEPVISDHRPLFIKLIVKGQEDGRAGNS
jgi:endonuclease/exonuclease/phosphatase family metal-dependent hydrolase